MERQPVNKEQIVQDTFTRLEEIHAKNGFLIMSTKKGEEKTGKAVADFLITLPDPLAEEVWLKITKAGLTIKGIDERPGKDLLTHREEIEHFIRFRNKDISARDEIMEKNQGLVWNMAIKLSGKGLEQDDLLQEGQIGLFFAVNKFDWRMGFKFSNYARIWIRQAMVRPLLKSKDQIIYPEAYIRQIFKLMETEALLRQTLGRKPKSTEIAEKMGISPTKVEGLKRNWYRTDYLSDPVGKLGERTLEDVVRDQNPGPEEIFDKTKGQEEAALILKEFFPVLTAQERETLTLKYFTTSERPVRQKEVAKTLGVARARIGQIEKAAYGKIRKLVKGNRNLQQKLGLLGLTELTMGSKIDD